MSGNQTGAEAGPRPTAAPRAGTAVGAATAGRLAGGPGGTRTAAGGSPLPAPGGGLSGAADRNTGRVAPDRNTGWVAPERSTGWVAPERSTGRVAQDRNTGRVAADRSTGRVAADRSTGRVAADRSTGRVAPDRDAGRVRGVPGGPKAPDSGRLPTPPWGSVLPDRPWSLGSAVAEPLPAGVWLRPADAGDTRYDHRTRLSGLRVRADLLTVVVGVPGAEPVPLADVARLWQGLPPHLRPAVRFVCYGPARLSGGRHFGDVLAQVVGEPVRLYNGVPGGADEPGEVLVVRQDGSPGRPLRGREFVHLPPTDSAAPPPSPFAAAHGWPLDGLAEISPGTHLLAEDAVVEVVRSGLWVRLPQDPPYAAEVRAADPDPGRERILCDADSAAALPRLRQLAADLVQAFPPELRGEVRLGVCRPTADGGRTAPAGPASRTGGSPDPVGSRSGPGGGRTGGARTGGRTGGARPATAPGPEHAGSLSVAAEVLHRHPELLADRPEPDAVAGLAAVLRRLADTADPEGTGAQAADGLTATADGELLRTGLRMLPVHHGATGLRATLDEAMRRWYAGQPLVVDPQACEASALGPGGEPGNTDFLIWSVAGRRTDLLDPLCPDRVLFLPGARFRVLAAEPGVVMMREVAPGRTPQDPELDRAAVRELTRARRAWRGTGGA
ncbi:hypothetical protein [Streptomyces naphthomycinicus]|uniref:hypothetical protein n=1 Tax=Streptomyces naphthomycinicus TaxID=2872625 RepID=UPI001CEC9D65|nr:hypothetical protein [Streptomyces sp. TML10]